MKTCQVLKKSSSDWEFPLSKKKTEDKYWLALMRAPGVGAVRFIRMINHFGNPRNVFEAGIEEWKALNLKENLLNYLQNPDWHAVEKDMKWLEQENHHLLTFDHPDYPPLLHKIADPPPLLFIHGDATLLSSNQLAIVGTRKPTKEGVQTAREFAEYLSHQGITITSGMALGIDGASHWGALAGSGKTIAVAGTGLDRVYPPEHRQLAYEIVEKGALVSEWPLGTTIQRRHFPIRSRVISGLSLGILVIESPEKSGALYAAKHAIKQGREIFAIPGSIHNPLVKGCHQLIKKEGAKLVEKAADILEELQIYRTITAQTTIEKRRFSPAPKLTSTNETFIASETSDDSSAFQQEHTPKNLPVSQQEIPSNETTVYQQAQMPSDLESDHVRLLDHLEVGPTSVDNLVELCGLTAGDVSSMLLMLELRGLVTLQSGGCYARVI